MPPSSPLTGTDTIRHTETALNVIIGFDVSNHRAVQHLRETRFRLISDITAEQRDAIQSGPGGRNCTGVESTAAGRERAARHRLDGSAVRRLWRNYRIALGAGIGGRARPRVARSPLRSPGEDGPLPVNRSRDSRLTAWWRDTGTGSYGIGPG